MRWRSGFATAPCGRRRPQPRRHRRSRTSARSLLNSAPTGRSVRSPSRPRRPCVAPTGREPTSIVSSSRVSSGRASVPVGPADKLTLLRRATLDLTGLPPSPDDVDAFLKDQSPDAFEKVIDRLLASPQYGETWGRLWLDVARYAEDDYRSLDPMGRGFNPYPNAHLYRDWVVRAFNDDLPYDQFVTAQLAADLLEGPARLRHLPALGFLGLGPWYYDNGAVEIMRADERHDRVDAVTRGMLGLTVGCARCHDHKYDPIPTKDYYSLAGVFLNTEYHEYPLAPKAIVTAQKAQEDALDQKREMLREYTNTEAMQLAGTLAFQSVKYMKAAWQVTGEPKKEKSEIIEKEKLDYELFDRWLAFLQRKPTFYPYLKDWQAMIAKGGTAKEAETLATAFQDEIISVLLEERELKKENDIIKAQALPTSKPKKPSNKPNEFKTNDDFCPGCGLELRSMTKERVSLFRDVFVVNLETDSFVPGQEPKPGLLRFRGWGLEQRLGDDRRMLIESLRKDIEAAQKKLENGYAYVHGVRDIEKPIDLQVHLRGNPLRLGDMVPRGFPSVLSPGEDHVLQGLRPPRTGADHRRASVGHARHRQSRVEGAFRHRHRRYAEQLRHQRRTADQSRTARSPRERVRRQRHVDQGAPPRNHAERGLSVERRAAGRGVREGRRQPPLLARAAPPAQCRADSRCGVEGLRRARRARRRSVDAADAARQSPDPLRPRQPLQDGRVPAALRLPEPQPVGRAALLDQRAAAAPVLHEQRLHPAACRARRRDASPTNRTMGADREGLSAVVRPRADGG